MRFYQTTAAVILGAILMLSGMGCAHKQGAVQNTPSVTRGVYPDPKFLDKNALDLRLVLPPPPLAGSKVDQADYAEILRLQEVRSKADCYRAGLLPHPKLNNLFEKPFGPLNSKEVALMFDFFEEVRHDTNYFVQESKTLYDRPRPYVANAKVNPCVDTEPTKAYPSGHATIGLVFAKVLAEIDPSRRTSFLKRAEQIAADRVLSGVHHPTDIESGKILGRKVFALLMQSKSFRTELDLIKSRYKKELQGK